MMAHMLIRNADPKRCGSLVNDMKSQCSRNTNQCPDNLEDAMHVLSLHKPDSRSAKDHKRKNSSREERHDGEHKEGTSHAHGGEATPTCWCCGAKEHKSWNCRKKDDVPRNEWRDRKKSTTGSSSGQSKRHQRCLPIKRQVERHACIQRIGRTKAQWMMWSARVVVTEKKQRQS